MGDTQRTFRWTVDVPILGNAVVLEQLGLALGVSFGPIVLLIALVSGDGVYALYALALIAATLVLTWLFVLIVYRNRYEAEFALDAAGVLCQTRTRQAGKNRIVNALAVLLGLLSRTPAAVGAGLLAQSRQRVTLRWGRITSVKYRPRQRTILLRAGWMERIALFCTPENYATVESEVEARTAHLRKEAAV